MNEYLINRLIKVVVYALIMSLNKIPTALKLIMKCLNYVKKRLATNRDLIFRFHFQFVLR